MVNVTVPVVNVLVKKDIPDLLANVLFAQAVAMATVLANPLLNMLMIFLTTQTMEKPPNFLPSPTRTKIVPTAWAPKIPVLNTIMPGTPHAPKVANVILDTVDRTVC